MAVLNFSGLESGSALEELAGGTGYSVDVAAAHRGLYGLRIAKTANNEPYFRLMRRGQASTDVAQDLAVDTVWISCYVKMVAFPASGVGQILGCYVSGTTDKATLRLTTTGTLDLYDSANALVASGTTVLNIGTWYLLHWKIGHEVGANDAPYELLIDGVSEYSGIGNFLANQTNAVYFGNYENRATNAYTVDFDNMVVDDAEFHTGHYVAGVVPTLDGSINGWRDQVDGSPKGSASYVRVDEIPSDSDTTYAWSGYVAGIGDEFETFTLKIEPDGSLIRHVFGIKTHFHTKETNSQSTFDVRVRVTLGATVAESTVGFDPGSGYGYASQMFWKDPDGSDWTPTTLREMEYGIRIVSRAGEQGSVRLSQAMVSILYDDIPGDARADSDCTVDLITKVQTESGDDPWQAGLTISNRPVNEYTISVFALAGTGVVQVPFSGIGDEYTGRLHMFVVNDQPIRMLFTTLHGASSLIDIDNMGNELPANGFFLAALTNTMGLWIVNRSTETAIVEVGVMDE